MKDDDGLQRTDFRTLPPATRLETGCNIEKSLQKQEAIVILHELFGLPINAEAAPSPPYKLKKCFFFGKLHIGWVCFLTLMNSGASIRLYQRHEGLRIGKNSHSLNLKAMIQSTNRRKVKITKVLGKKTGIKLQSSFVGLEEMPPKVGKSYRVYVESGKVLRTTPVSQVLPDFIKTENSLYRIEILGNN